MIGFLRFVGIFNAAVWFGAAVYLLCGVSPATGSGEMKALLGTNNFPYFSVAVSQLVAARFYDLGLVCGIVAVLHVMAEWLYLGKVQPRCWRWVLAGLVAANLLNGFWLQPKLERLHRVRFAANAAPEARAATHRSFSTWQTLSFSINLAVVGGLAVYLWRVANPPDPARFVSAMKFRS